MSKKHFSWLVGVTLIVALVILFMPGKTSRESAVEIRPLVPGLAVVGEGLGVGTGSTGFSAGFGVERGDGSTAGVGDADRAGGSTRGVEVVIGAGGVGEK